MGKQRRATCSHQCSACADTQQQRGNANVQAGTESEIKELIVIGSGPHALSLVLRLLEPDADFLSDKERHLQAEYRDRMRPDRDVIQHVRNLARGPRATLRQPRKKCQKKRQVKEETSAPPPLSLEKVQKDVLVVDKCGGWMSCWKTNFKHIGIKKLRSLMNAHADPFDHRSLEFYAELLGRGHELVTLKSLTQRDNTFKGPYQVPSTDIFNSFHDLLANAYGISDIVRKGTVLSVTPTQGDDKGPIFLVEIAFGDEENPEGVRLIKTRHVVSAMGPMFQHRETFWEENLRKQLDASPCRKENHILHSHEIVPFLKELQENTPGHMKENPPRILLVGGGITSAQLALSAAKADWCSGVTLIQRSKMKARHFDINNEYMGPKRGILLDEFWNLDMRDRAQRLQEARGGGTIPPLVIQELLRYQEQDCLELKEEVEILEVHFEDHRLHVTLDDGSAEDFDMIWLSVGAENHIDFYSPLSSLRDVLPINEVNGLPVLDKDLSWRAPDGAEHDEPDWKRSCRKCFYCMGALAGLELGPDALNLVGSRHGSVKVAKALRKCIT